MLYQGMNRKKLQGRALAEFKATPKQGEATLMMIEGFSEIGNIIRCQREYWNGSGYPDGLLKDKIPLESRILCVINDYYDALNGALLDQACTEEEALEHLQKKSGVLYDAQVVQVFSQCVDSDKIEFDSTMIALKDVRPGMILSQDLITASGILLLPDETVLTVRIIEKVRDFAGIDSKMMISVKLSPPIRESQS